MKNDYPEGSRMHYAQARFFKDFQLPTMAATFGWKRIEITLQTLERFLGQKEDMIDFAMLFSGKMRKDTVKNCNFEDDICNKKTELDEEEWCCFLGDLCYDMICKQTIDMGLFWDSFGFEWNVSMEIDVRNTFLYEYIYHAQLNRLLSFLFELNCKVTEKKLAERQNHVLMDFYKKGLEAVWNDYNMGCLRYFDIMGGYLKTVNAIREHDEKLRELGLSETAANILDVLTGEFLCGEWNPELIEKAKSIEAIANRTC